MWISGRFGASLSEVAANEGLDGEELSAHIGELVLAEHFGWSLEAIRGMKWLDFMRATAYVTALRRVEADQRAKRG